LDHSAFLGGPEGPLDCVRGMGAVAQHRIWVELKVVTERHGIGVSRLLQEPLLRVIIHERSIHLLELLLLDEDVCLLDPLIVLGAPPAESRVLLKVHSLLPLLNLDVVLGHIGLRRLGTVDVLPDGTSPIALVLHAQQRWVFILG